MDQPKTGKFQMFEELPEDRYQSLKQGIREEGVRVPVEIDQHGQVIDGHHRIRAWNELRAEGVDIQDYPRIIRSFDSDEDRRYAAISINSQRRDISEIDRKEKAALLRADGRSYEDIATALGIGTTTAWRWCGEAESTFSDEKVGAPQTITSSDGRKMPTSYNTKPEPRNTIEVDSDTGEILENDWKEEPPASAPAPLYNPQPEPKAPAPHVSHNSGENEWYTPSQYIEAAREVLGTIDLDPASSEVANERVKATSYFTKDDNGLAHEWHGNVWMNPPYAQPLISEFCAKVVEEFEAGRVKAAIVLVNNATETRWFRQMTEAATAICFPTGRIKYLDSTGHPANTPLQGQAFLYFGDDTYGFISTFRQFGFVVEVA